MANDRVESAIWSNQFGTHQLHFLERLMLTGSASLKGAGNALANTLTGNDTLNGGAGRDILNGGIGADPSLFDDGDFSGTSATTADRIIGFSQAEGDKLRFDLVDANTANGTADDAFAFIGTQAFGGVAGQLRYERIGGNTYVQGDQTGMAMPTSGSHSTASTRSRRPISRCRPIA